MSLISRLNRKLFYKEVDREVKIKDAVKTIATAIIHNIGLDQLADDWLKNNSHPFIKISTESFNVTLLLDLDKYADIIKELVFDNSEYGHFAFLTDIGAELKSLYVPQVGMMRLLPAPNWNINDRVVIFDDFKNQPTAEQPKHIKVYEQPTQCELRFFGDEELTIVYPSRISIHADYEFSYTVGLFNNEPSKANAPAEIKKVTTGSGMPLTSFAITANSVNRTISLPGFTTEVREKFAKVYSKGITDGDHRATQNYDRFFSSVGFMNMVVCSDNEMVIFSTPELPFINDNKLSIESKIPKQFMSLSQLTENLVMEKIDRGLTTLILDGYTVSWFVYTHFGVEHKEIY